MDGQTPEQRWIAALAAFAAAMPYHGSRPCDPLFALEFSPFAVAAKRRFAGA